MQPIAGAMGPMQSDVPLGVGDRLPGFNWVDHQSTGFSLIDDHHAGKVTVLVVCASPDAPGVEQLVAGLVGLHEALAALGVQAFVVTAGPVARNAALADRLNSPFPVICDAGFAIGRAIGLTRPAAPGPAAPETSPGRMLLILDESRRIERLIEPLPGEDPLRLALAHCDERAAARKPVVVTRQPPVLIVPNVIDGAHCARLIDYWEKGERYAGGVAGVKGGKHDVKKAIKVREDVALPDLQAEAQELFAIFRRRLFPEIRRIFKFHVSRAETLRLGCYDAREGGAFKPHRDDTSPHVAHRRFAASLFLNTGAYEGGHLHFPEYGPQLYDPEAGSVIIFSCSMLHGVTPVTAGRRFVLLGFFHGEAEEAMRRARKAEYEYTMVDYPAKLYSIAPADPSRR